jgi:hypothetical protein
MWRPNHTRTERATPWLCPDNLSPASRADPNVKRNGLFLLPSKNSATINGNEEKSPTWDEERIVYPRGLDIICNVALFLRRKQHFQRLHKKNFVDCDKDTHSSRSSTSSNVSPSPRGGTAMMSAGKAGSKADATPLIAPLNHPSNRSSDVQLRTGVQLFYSTEPSVLLTALSVTRMQKIPQTMTLVSFQLLQAILPTLMSTLILIIWLNKSLSHLRSTVY